jgi:hypothetical protein
MDGALQANADALRKYAGINPANPRSVMLFVITLSDREMQ